MMTGYIFVVKKIQDLTAFYMGHLDVNELDKFMIVKEEDFDYFETRLFDYINVECNLLIDKYEEETLPNDRILSAINIVNILINNSDDSKFIAFSKEFLNILTYANENGKNVEFKF